MKKENLLTEIVFITDRSGSMSKIASDMEEGYNTFIANQKEVEGECFVSLFDFDHKHRAVFERKPLAEVPALKIEPRGNTALYDAIGLSVTRTQERISQLKEEYQPKQVIFVIITDGQENASSDYNRDKIFGMIDGLRKTKKFEFIFLGANQDSLRTSADLGISAKNAVTYTTDRLGSVALMNGLSRGIASSRTYGINASMYSQDAYAASVAEVVANEPDKK